MRRNKGDRRLQAGGRRINVRCLMVDGKNREGKIRVVEYWNNRKIQTLRDLFPLKIIMIACPHHFDLP